jgi:hypothetical protein
MPTLAKRLGWATQSNRCQPLTKGIDHFFEEYSL